MQQLLLVTTVPTVYGTLREEMKMYITPAVTLHQLPVVSSRCTVLDTVEKEVHRTAVRPLTILKSLFKSALLCISSKDHSPNLLNLSS